MRHLLLAVAVLACGTDDLYPHNQTTAAEETEVVDREHPYNPLSVDTAKSRPAPWCDPHFRPAMYGDEDRSIHLKREQLCEKGEAQ